MRNVEGTEIRVRATEYIACLDNRHVLVRESQPPEPPRELLVFESDNDSVESSDPKQRTDSVRFEEVEGVWYTSNAFRNRERRLHEEQQSIYST